jgi:uncharacterized protein (TIGR02246 family)
MNATTRKATEETQIRWILDDRIDALRVRDAKRFMSHFADDFVTFELAPPLQYTEGASGNAEGLEAWFTSFKGPVDYQMQDLRISASDSVAFCHSLYHITGTKTDGHRTDMWTRQTLCLRKIDGEWKISHSHMSVPFYMDGSDKASLDLKP